MARNFSAPPVSVSAHCGAELLLATNSGGCNEQVLVSYNTKWRWNAAASPCSFCSGTSHVRRHFSKGTTTRGAHLVDGASTLFHPTPIHDDTCEDYTSLAAAKPNKNLSPAFSTVKTFWLTLSDGPPRSNSRREHRYTLSTSRAP